MTNFGKPMTIRQWQAMLDDPPVRECDEEASDMLARVLALVEAVEKNREDGDFCPPNVMAALAAMKEAGDIE